MKIMYPVYQICFWSYIITALLYLTYILGLYAQFFLGIIHVLSAVYCFGRYQDLDQRMKRSLKNYAWLVVIYFFVSFFIGTARHPLFQELALIYLTVVPMSIGLYFVSVMHGMRHLDKTVLTKKQSS